MKSSKVRIQMFLAVAPVVATGFVVIASLSYCTRWFVLMHETVHIQFLFFAVQLASRYRATWLTKRTRRLLFPYQI